MNPSRSLPCKIAVSLAPFVLACAAGGPRHLNPPDRADSRPFSHGVLAGDTYWVAGTLGLEPDGSVPADVEREIRLAMDGIAAKLALAGLTMDDLVSVQVFCPDLELYDTFNRIYAGYFTDGRYPVRAFIGSGPLLRGARFEITAVASCAR